MCSGFVRLGGADFEMLHGVGDLARFIEGTSEIVTGLEPIGLKVHRILEAEGRGNVVLKSVLSTAAGIPSADELRVEIEGSLIGSRGCGIVTGFLDDVGSFAEDFGVVGLKFQGLPKAADGVGDAVLPFVEEGEVDVKRRAIFELEGAVEAAFGIGVILDGGQSEAEGVLVIGLVRGDSDGFEEKVGSSFVLATLVFEATKKVKSACVNGIFFKKLAIALGGFGEVARAVVVVSALE